MSMRVQMQDFSRFLVALAVLATYRYPDPFLPLSAKLQTFHAGDISNVIKMKRVTLKELA
jgi:hypothetical protein